MKSFLLVLTIAMGIVQTGCAADQPTAYRVYVGTYTAPGGSEGIYRFDLDAETGQAGEPVLAASATNPSFLAIDSERKRLFAVGEIGRFQGRSTGSVSAYTIEEGGNLSPLNTEASMGGGPCHVSLDAQGRHVLVANYGGGSAAVLPVGEDGKLKPASDSKQLTYASKVNPQRQEAPHAHSINLSPDGKWAVLADLGSDRVYVYRFDAASGKLIEGTPAYVELPAGGGPRHFAFHPTRPYAFANNELTSSVTAMRWDSQSGVLTPIQTVSTLPPDHQLPGDFKKEQNSTAETVVHPSGKWLYVSNRGHDSIAVFAIESDGQLQPVGHHSTEGKTPRNFAVTPDGRWLIAANQNSDTLRIYSIEKSGALQRRDQVVHVAKPVCVRFVAVHQSWTNPSD